MLTNRLVVGDRMGVGQESIEAERGETGRILRGVRWTYVSIIIQGALKFGVLIVLARVLEPRDFGLLGFALMCTSLIERIGQAGVGPALVQQRVVDADMLATGHVVSLVFGVGSTLVVCLAAPSLASFFAEPQLEIVLYVLSAGCFVEALGVTRDAVLQRELRFKELMLAENVAYLVAMGGVATTLALLGYGVWALVAATLLLKVVRVVVLYLTCPPFPHGHGCWSHGRTLARMGLGFSLARVLNFFSLQGDNFVVGRMLGVDALGLYSRAYQLMTLPAMYVGQVVERVMFPVMARKQDARRTLRAQYLFIVEVIALVALPAGVGMFLLSREIVLVAFGARWEAIIPVLSVLAYGVFFRTAYKCSDTVVRSMGAVYHYAARQFMYTVMVVGGAWIGATFAGVTGVAVAVVAAVALNYLSMTRLTKRLIDVSWSEFIGAHLSAVWASLWLALGIYGARWYLEPLTEHPFVVLSVAGVTGCVAVLTGLVCGRSVVPSRVIPVVWQYVRLAVCGRARTA